MFFTLSLSKNLREIHLGTSWDFLRIKKNHQSFIYYYLIEGLLNLLNAAEQGEIPYYLKFRGNSHYINYSTLKKYGFISRKLNMFEYILFFFNYLEICFLKSIIQKKLIFHKISSLRIVYIDMSDLIRNKSYLILQYNKLAKRLQITKSKFTSIEDKINIAEVA